MKDYKARAFFKDYLNLGRIFGYYNAIFIFLKLKFTKNITLSLPNFKHEIFLRGETSDTSVFNQIFIRREYEIKDILDGFVPKTILDGGANIGIGSVYFKSLFPDVKIIAVEPSGQNFQMLKKNTEKYQDIHVLQGAIWNSNQTLKIFDKYEQGFFSLVVSENGIGDVEKEDTKAFTIGKLFEMYQLDSLDILKLDVETAEKHIFSSNYEDWLGKCKFIIIELHDIMEKGCSMAFFNALQNSIKNYSLYIKGENIVIKNETL